MAKKASRRPRRDSGSIERVEPAAPEEEVPPVAPVKTVEAAFAPPPPDTNVQLAIVGLAAIGALLGGVGGFANWGMTPTAGLEGLLGGLAMGAAAGHSLLLSFRLQALVVIIMVTIAFSLYNWMGQTWQLAPLGLLVAGVVSMILSLLLARLNPP